MKTLLRVGIFLCMLGICLCLCIIIGAHIMVTLPSYPELLVGMVFVFGPIFGSITAWIISKI